MRMDVMGDVFNWLKCHMCGFVLHDAEENKFKVHVIKDFFSLSFETVQHLKCHFDISKYGLKFLIIYPTR